MAKRTCPFLRKPCIEAKCMMWREMTFTPSNGEGVKVLYDCSINWQMVMQIEQAKQMRQTAASADKMANEINAAAGTLLLSRAGLMEQPDGQHILEKPDGSDTGKG